MLLHCNIIIIIILEKNKIVFLFRCTIRPLSARNTHKSNRYTHIINSKKLNTYLIIYLNETELHENFNQLHHVESKMIWFWFLTYISIQ